MGRRCVYVPFRGANSKGSKQRWRYIDITCVLPAQAGAATRWEQDIPYYVAVAGMTGLLGWNCIVAWHVQRCWDDLEGSFVKRFWCTAFVGRWTWEG